MILLLLGMIVPAGCVSNPVAGNPTKEIEPTQRPVATETPSATVLPTGELHVTDMPVPTNTATPAPTSTATPAPTSTDTPAPTSTATPEPTSTATPAPTNTATPAPRPSLKPTATPVPSVTPVLVGTPVPSLTGTPVLTGEVMPTATPKLPGTPKPTGEGTGTPELSNTPVPEPTVFPEPPEDYGLLLQNGWQRTQDFFEEKEIYFPGGFVTARITAEDGKYLCEYQKPQDAKTVFLMEGLENAEPNEVLSQLQEGREPMLLREEEAGTRYCYWQENKVISGIVYACQNGAVMRLEMQSRIEDKEELPKEFFYVR